MSHYINLLVPLPLLLVDAFYTFSPELFKYKLKIAKEKYPSSDRSEKHFITLNTSSQEF